MFSFSIIIFDLIELLVILFIMKLIAQTNISKHTYYPKYAYYPIILQHPLSYNYAKSVYYSKAIIYHKYTYYPIVALSNIRFIRLLSKLELNFDLVLGSSLGNRPQLTTQSLLLVKPVLVERFFHFQSSILLFAQHRVYLQMFHLSELWVNEFDEFWLLAVQCLPFKSFFLEFCKCFVVAMCAGSLCAISTKTSSQYVELFPNLFESKCQRMRSIQDVVILLSISWSVN